MRRCNGQWKRNRDGDEKDEKEGVKFNLKDEWEGEGVAELWSMQSTVCNWLIKSARVQKTCHLPPLFTPKLIAMLCHTVLNCAIERLRTSRVQTRWKGVLCSRRNPRVWERCARPHHRVRWCTARAWSRLVTGRRSPCCSLSPTKEREEREEKKKVRK